MFSQVNRVECSHCVYPTSSRLHADYPVVSPLADPSFEQPDLPPPSSSPYDYGAFELDEDPLADLNEDLFALEMAELDRWGTPQVGAGVMDGPSLPIILFSAACGIAAGIIGLYLAYFILQLNIPASAGIGVLSMLGALAGVAFALTRLTESRATAINIGMSCGLAIFTLFFFAICTIAGALAAALILTWGG